jgi:Methyltransferase FkbM domain
LGSALRRTLLRPGTVWKVPLGLGRGIRLAVDPKAPVQKYLGTTEREIAKYIRRFTSTGTRSLDVGGHDAHDALILAARTGAEVVTFEFDPVCIDRMQRNLALNPQLARRVTIIATYLAHETVENPRADAVDDLIASGEVYTPDFVKIDVEGAEAIVLSGAREMLTRRRPHLVIETHSAVVEQQCLHILRAAEYSPVIVDRRRWLSEHRDSSHNRWIVAAGQK